ncbi:MAG: linear amide C-N hydrolase [Bacteroidales bacterium]|nr:linear amide C-N hydrolase [Bacteroidales bacterium]
MKRRILFGFLIACMLSLGYLWYCNSDRYYKLKDNTGCSTILINNKDTIMVGHNLDDYIEVPGVVYINKRGVIKENISWSDFSCLRAKKSNNKRIQWTSKFGSITYNTWGKDFPDGGMNEEGLYIGEMTLIGTTWIDTDVPAFHHHFFMQYILDNFKTTQEVVDIMDNIRIDGHCQWHYFVADKFGNTAVIEYLNDSMKIYTEEQMPYKVLCNRAYKKELGLIPSSDSLFNKMLDEQYKSRDLRFMYALKKMGEYYDTINTPLLNFVFSILSGMNLGNNKWSIVYDISNLKMYFRTSKGQDIKYLSFRSFDFNCNTAIKLIDINSNISGDITDNFVNYSEELNKDFIKKNFDQINFGFFGNLFIKGRYQRKINKYSNSFKCSKN